MNWFLDPDGRPVEVTGEAAETIPDGWTLLPEHVGAKMAADADREAVERHDEAVARAGRAAGERAVRQWALIERLAVMLDVSAADVADLFGVQNPVRV